VQLVLNANAYSFCQIALLRVVAVIVLPCVLGGVSGPVALSGCGQTFDELDPGVILFRAYSLGVSPPIYCRDSFFSRFSALLSA
jgi:hypothetical protein